MVTATYAIKLKTESLSQSYCLGKSNILRTREYLFEQLAFFHFYIPAFSFIYVFLT